VTQSNSFPKPTAYAATEVPSSLAGWEAMYPSHFFFGGVREEWENRHFWYLDKIHAPYPLPPLDHIFQQAWQISLSQHTTRVFCIPPAQGIAQRIVGCYQYICAVEPPPDEVIGEKAALFQARAHYPVEHYSELWDEWLVRVQKLGGELKGIHVPSELPRYVPDNEMFPDGFKGYTAAYELMEAFSRAVDCIYKGWQYHFNYLNLAYLYYLTFFGAAKTLFPGVSDAAVSKMVAGADVSMFRPDAELCRLARLAYEEGPVAAVLEREETAAEKIVSLREIQSGRDWLDEFEKIRDPWLHISTGSGWYYNEGSWLNKLDVPFGYIKNYIERLQNGERIERSLDEIGVARDALVGEYRTLIRTDEDRVTFDNAYNDTRIIYKYAEDHLFWIEHWFHTLWWEKIREIGEVLVKAGSLKKVDDIFMFNRFEVPALIEDSATRWALGEGVPSMDWAGTATKRHGILDAAGKWIPSPALGQTPEVVAEPFTIMLWGVTTDKVGEWLKGSSVDPGDLNEIKGFASSSGVAEGIARVLHTADEIMKLKAGEILVCPSTNPSWGPALGRVGAAVTDIGGLTSHAAIVAREYGLPAVTGTGFATTAIKTGDRIRVDGDTGVVTIIERAKD
jgi:pyruvate,water dikinase